MVQLPKQSVSKISHAVLTHRLAAPQQYVGIAVNPSRLVTVHAGYDVNNMSFSRQAISVLQYAEKPPAKEGPVYGRRYDVDNHIPDLSLDFYLRHHLKGIFK
jgi:hypothetical protein